ncbi:P-loop containing nucleoside triphosphate hydrolase protein [Xylariomycetidae sp. FL0641]|nr:P-loop containing nucleoside triphosphate hydrolase protein [Xylariomycetidae sp. FL0641]
MSAATRFVDTLPPPEKVREKKVITLSYSRSGTLGLCQAYEILGLKPYSMMEVLRNGLPHITMFHEALRAKCLGEGQPYTKADLDKWLWDYDIVAAYPDAKFVLTTRAPAAWATSVWATIGQLHARAHAFPLALLQRLDATNRAFCALVDLIFGVVLTGGHGRTPAGWDAAVREYAEYNERVRALVPPDRLLVVRLEDGLGWEQICPFLGVDVPAVPYPRKNDTRQFQANLTSIFAPGNRRAVAILTAALGVVVVACGLWYVW